MMKTFRYVLGLMVLLPCAMLFVRPVRAFEVSPGVFDLSIAAGSSTQRQIVIKNTDTEPRTFFLTVQKFRDGANGRPVFLDPSDTEGLPTWIRVSEPEFALAPGQEKRVLVRVDVPSAAPAAGAYAAVFVTERPAGASAFSLARRIGTLFLVSVDGEASSERVEIQRLSAGVRSDGRGIKSWVGLLGSAWAEAEVRNMGNVHGVIGSRLTVGVSGVFGSEAFEATSSMRVLPGERRRLHAGGRIRSPIGFVTATLELGNGRRQVLSREWYALPSAYVFFAAGVLTAVGGACLVRRKRLRRLGVR